MFFFMLFLKEARDIFVYYANGFSVQLFSDC